MSKLCPRRAALPHERQAKSLRNSHIGIGHGQISRSTYIHDLGHSRLRFALAGFSLSSDVVVRRRSEIIGTDTV